MSEDAQRPRGPMPVLAVVGGLILALWIIFHDRGGAVTSVTAEPAPEMQPMSRELFRSVCRPVMPASECLSALGPPSKTQKGTGYEYWYYEGKTFDKLTGKRDVAAQLVLKEDLVPSAKKKGAYEPGSVVTAVNFY